MRKIYFSVQFILLLFTTVAMHACAQSKKHAAELRVILVRHGEKPDNGDNLSCAGLNRSLKLPEVIKSKFGLPDRIYVPSPDAGKQTKNVRMLQTATPFAAKYNLTINSDFEVDDSGGLVQKLAKNGGTALVIWEHKELPQIASKLGVKNVPDWKASDYDSIWIITISNGHASMAIDKEGIVPAAGCSF